MFKILTCETNNFFSETKPKITPNKHPDNDQIVFCLSNFDTPEVIDGYTPQELLLIRNTIDQAINENCKMSDLQGQMFFWNIDAAGVSSESQSDHLNNTSN